MTRQNLDSSINDLRALPLSTSSNLFEEILDNPFSLRRSSSYGSVGQTPNSVNERWFTQEPTFPVSNSYLNKMNTHLSTSKVTKVSDSQSSQELFFPLLDTTRHIDFEGNKLASGTVMSDQIEGIRISTDSDLSPMLFDAAHPTGGDKDLKSSIVDHVLIISEDNDSFDPDDSADGGVLRFEFQNLSDITSISFLDIDESGTTIDFYGLWGNHVQSFDVPKMKNNKLQTFDFNVESVAYMDISLAGSGAIADLEIASTYSITDLAINPDINPDIPLNDQPTIGIIDTGFNGNNPDIDYSRITLGSDRIDNDDNPLINTSEGGEHGTHILGKISAINDNNIGIDGINDKAPIWMSRAIGSGELADVIAEFVVSHIDSERSHAILNLSLDLTQKNPDGSITTRYELTPAERQAIEFARQHNVILVVAAGNDGGVMSALGQASQEFDNIIVAGAADGLERAAYSSHGVGLDILAPGGTPDNPILSTVSDGLGSMAGTSVATAYVTGAISQVWAANPELNYRQVIDIIKATAIDLDIVGWDAETGHGLLNLAGALKLAETAPLQEHYSPASVIPTTWSGEGTLVPLERAVGRRPYEFASLGEIDDTLWEIAERELGDPYRWVEIQRADGTTYTEEEAKLIQAGTIVYLPDDTSNPNPTPSPSPSPITDPQLIVPIDTNSDNYTKGQINPYAYNPALIGQCTWFTYGRMVETGLLPDSTRSQGWFLGNAATWAGDAIQAGLPVTDTPTQGARGIVVFPAGIGGAHGQYGHVAFLEEVYADGSIRISEANWAGVKTPTERTLSPAQYGGMKFVQLENANVIVPESPPAAVPGAQTEYIVQPSDTLWGIAERYLGDGDRWREITGEDGTTFTEEEARYLEVGSSVYLSVYYESSPIPIINSPIFNPDPEPVPDIQPIPEVDEDNWERLGYAVWDWTRNGDDTSKYTQSPVLRKFSGGSLADETAAAAIDSAKETVLVVHGWEGFNSAATPVQSDEAIYELAKSISNQKQDTQVFILDWHLQAESKILPHFAAGWAEPVADWTVATFKKILPHFAAGWAEPVADWTVATFKKIGIENGDNVTVIGHSLGAYVASEIADEYGGVKGLIALDPAAYGSQEYDLNWTTSGVQKPNNFWDVTDRTLAFVGSDFLQGGLFGDNILAATAHDSFIVDFNFADASEVHSGVTQVFRNIIERNHLSSDFTNWILPEHQDNWYDHDDLGLKFDPFSQPDKFHEGIIFTQGSGFDRSVKELQTITGKDWLGFPIKKISWT